MDSDFDDPWAMEPPAPRQKYRVSENPAVYHITDVTNLANILWTKSIIAKNRLEQIGIIPTNIALPKIQEGRDDCEVTVGPGGWLHDYVPFSFAPRSPMLNAIHEGRVPGARQATIVHLRCTIADVRSRRLPFVFTDTHPTGYSQSIHWYDDLADLEYVDWDVMRTNSWGQRPDDPGRRHRRMAEFLIHGEVPWDLVTLIGVPSMQIRTTVLELLGQYGGQQPPVEVRPGWYYY